MSETPQDPWAHPPESGDGTATPTQPSPYGQPAYGQPQYAQPAYGQPQYAQAPYGQAPYGYGAATGARNGLGTAALICGIVAIVLCWTVFFGIVLGILGIVFGIVGRG